MLQGTLITRMRGKYSICPAVQILMCTRVLEERKYERKTRWQLKDCEISTLKITLKLLVEWTEKVKLMGIHNGFIRNQYDLTLVLAVDNSKLT